LVKWAYASITAVAYSNHARPIWVFLPTLRFKSEVERQRYETLSELARAVGFVPLSLEGVWDGHDARSLQIAPGDIHPKPAGHALIADRFYDELAINWKILAPAK
jgi:hypothetical protein